VKKPRFTDEQIVGKPIAETAGPWLPSVRDAIITD
jgi:hypothetical protein